jgi:membrane protein YdbS with pleckstrin-like domain
MAAPSNEPDDDPTDERPAETTETDTNADETAGADRTADEAAGTDEAVATGDGTPTDVSEFTTDERTVTASVQLIWALRALVGVAILGVIAGVVATEFGVDTRYVVAGTIALAVLALVWVHLRYRVWSYRVREDALYLERGVITNVKTVAPYVRIQHVDTQRGPLERALGLSTLVVYTAGSRGADVSIPGLRTDVAADLQGRVKELAIESEGGDAL